MPRLHLHHFDRLSPTLSVLPRSTDFDRRVLVGHCESLVVVANDVRDWEISAAIVLRGSEEGFEDVREE